jgi:DNA-binding MarR family transcriptional regulator
MSSIEELIQQPKFKNPYQRALISLVFANNALNYHFQEFLKNYDITSQQYNVLRILRGQHPKPATVNLIRERMLDKNSDVSRIVERLRKSALLERVTCVHDRRAVDVVITNKGLNLLKAIDDAQKMEGELLLCFNESEILQLNTLLDKLIETITGN